MSYSNSFPSVRPTTFDFANSGKLDSRISFSRADSTPSAVHYWSNEKHLSSENLITQSQFSGWAKLTSPTVTPSYTDGPDGSSNTATRLQSASGADRYFYSTETSWTSGQQYTVSCWVKSNTGVAQTFAFFLPTTAYASADLTTHATDWTRITATFTAATSSIYCGFKLLSANTTDLSIWGFQVNSGANALDYQATSGSIHREYSSTLKSVTNAGDPRFEYDPASDGQSVGLLIESSASNLQRYGSAFASWATKANLASNSNQAIAPNGELEADLLVPNAGNDYHYIYDGQASVASGTTYTFSVYLKAAGYRYVQLLALSPMQSSGHVTYDLEAGTLSANGAHTGTIESVGNGWFRASATVTATSTATSGFLIAGADSISTGRNRQTIGNAYDGWLAWGAQLETGSAASSLANSGTSSSGVTRAADSCSVDLGSVGMSGGDFSLVFDMPAGSGRGNYPILFEYGLVGTTTNRFQVYKSSTSASDSDRWYALQNSTGIGYFTGSAGSSKVGISYANNDLSVDSDTGTLFTDTSQMPPLANHLALGSNDTFTSNQLNGHIKRVALYNVALSDTELAALTS